MFVTGTDMSKFKPIKYKLKSALDLWECFFFLDEGGQIWLVWSFLFLPALDVNVMVGAEQLFCNHEEKSKRGTER